jgi:hypothetical protein
LSILSEKRIRSTFCPGYRKRALTTSFFYVKVNIRSFKVVSGFSDLVGGFFLLRRENKR